MRYSRMFAMVVAAVACGIGGGAMALSIAERPEPAEKASTAQLVDGMNTFGLRVFGQLDKKGNLFFSPLSLHAALSMASVGARGDTHTEMATVLGLPRDQAGKLPSPAAVGGLYKEFFDGLLKDAAKTKSQEFSIANGLWLDKKSRLVEGFDEVMKKDFQSEAAVVDFKDAQAAAKTINDWVAAKTKDRIQDIVTPDVVEDAALALANALYFKAPWAQPFKEDRTTDGEFTLADGKKAKAKMMTRQGRYDYAETNDAQVLSLPYEGYRFSMVIVLPKKKDGLAELEKTLSAKQLTAWTKFKREDVRVTLPRFKTTRGFDAAEPLEKMGMKLAFDRAKADFSGTVDIPVYISHVMHKAFVAVDEGGTEAAAATVVGRPVTSVPPRPKEIKEFKADHPFLFMIRHDETGAILFLGRLADPTKE